LFDRWKSRERFSTSNSESGLHLAEILNGLTRYANRGFVEHDNGLCSTHRTSLWHLT